MTDMEETENTSGAAEETEDIIELTDIVKDDGEEESGAAALADVTDESGDEGIIELTDIVEEAKEEAVQEDEAVLELTDILQENQPGSGTAGKEEQEAVAEDTPGRDETDDDTGIDLDLEGSGPDAAAGSGDIDADTIQAALEKVIEKKFGGGIESLLLEVMEKVMTKEINDIKDALQKDLNSIRKS